MHVENLIKIYKAIMILRLVTDHKPLESTVRKEIDKSPVQLEKMLMTLQRYEYFTRNNPRKEQVLADMLSRSSTAWASATGK